MNEKVHASRVSHNIFVISGITRDSDDTPVIFDSVPVRGLDGIAVVDLECDDSQPIAFVNGAVDGKFLDRDLNSLRGEFLSFSSSMRILVSSA